MKFRVLVSRGYHRVQNVRLSIEAENEEQANKQALAIAQKYSDEEVNENDKEFEMDWEDTESVNFPEWELIQVEETEED